MNNPLYQGRDWFSENWTVAQTYDALDKIHDLCLYQTKETSASSLFTGHLPLLSYLMTALDTLHKGLTHMAQELIPINQHMHIPKKRWILYEMQLLENKINDRLTDLSDKSEKSVLQEILTLTLALKSNIRKLDQ